MWRGNCDSWGKGGGLWFVGEGGGDCDSWGKGGGIVIRGGRGGREGESIGRADTRRDRGKGLVCHAVVPRQAHTSLNRYLYLHLSADLL